jgi:hypothetical protein
MAAPWDGQLHTLAQLAHRAGISESRARALYPAKLPPPDRHDAGERPLWWSATIDAWCSRTGRSVNADATWLFQIKVAAQPPAELRRGLVALGPRRRPVTYYTVVWDTPRGHLIYLMPLGEWQHPDRVAHRAAALIEPRWWPDAVVVMPFPQSLALGLEEPHVYIYRLTTEPTPDPSSTARPRVTRPAPIPASRAGGSALAGLRRWFAGLTEDPRDHSGGGGVAPDSGATAAAPRAEWVTSLSMDEIARPLGAPLPLWIDGTLTEQHVNRTFAYGGTITVPDETTGWPQVQRRVERALEIELSQHHPAAWAVLAVDARKRLEQIRADHAALPDTTAGWQLMARPAAPQLSLTLENRLTTAELVEDPRQVADELTALRAAVADLNVDDPRADVYTEAITLLTLQLSHQLTEQRKAPANTAVMPAAEIDAVLDQTTVPFFAPWHGPVIEEWRSTLTPVPDLAAALRRRRLVDLLPGERLLDADAVEAIYRDVDGRYIVVPAEDDGDRYFQAEWPVSLDAVSTWNDQTVIAADQTHEATALLALTPTNDGGMRVDPVPVPDRTGYRHAFAYGYDGGTPAGTYTALIRCALPDQHHLVQLHDFRRVVDPADPPLPSSELWDALVDTRGPLRLPWQKIQRWARADLETCAARRE